MKLKTKIQDKDVRIKVMNALARREHSEKEIYLKSLLTAEKPSRILQQRLSYRPVDNTLTRSFTKSTD